MKKDDLVRINNVAECNFWMELYPDLDFDTRILTIESVNGDFCYCHTGIDDFPLMQIPLTCLTKARLPVQFSDL